MDTLADGPVIDVAYAAAGMVFGLQYLLVSAFNIHSGAAGVYRCSG